VTEEFVIFISFKVPVPLQDVALAGRNKVQ